MTEHENGNIDLFYSNRRQRQSTKYNSAHSNFSAGEVGHAVVNVAKRRRGPLHPAWAINSSEPELETGMGGN